MHSECNDNSSDETSNVDEMEAIALHAQAALEKGDYRQAALDIIACFDTLSSLTPRLCHLRSQALFRLGRFDEALDSFDSALALVGVTTPSDLVIAHKTCSRLAQTLREAKEAFRRRDVAKLMIKVGEMEKAIERSPSMWRLWIIESSLDNLPMHLADGRAAVRCALASLPWSR